MSTQDKKPGAGKLAAIVGGVSLFVGVIAIAVGKEMGYIEPDLSKRAIGFLLGLILMVSGNYLPKAVMPVSARRRNPARAMAAERFAGYVFVLAGLASAIVAVTMTAGGVMYLASMIGLGAFVVVGLNWLLLLLGGKADPADSPVAEFEDASESPQMRRGLLAILNALFWAFAMLVTDHYFGDTATQWLLVPFLMINFWLGISMTRKMKGGA